MHLILLVQTPQDAADLIPAVPRLKTLALSALWLIHSPAVLVDLSASNAEVDRQILAVNLAIDQAVRREDYTGAESYKQQRHALTLQKSAAATNGYKTMTPEQQEEATKRVFGEFWASQVAPKMQLSMHPQHHETREWIEMLNSLKGIWPAEMAHGNFIVAWPGQFVGGPAKFYSKENVEKIVNLTPPPKTEVAPAGQGNAAQQKPARKGYTAHPRFKQLCSMGLDALSQIVLTYQMNPNTMGGNRLKMAHAVGKHEQQNNLLDTPKA